MAYTNIALSKFISQQKNDALPNSQGLDVLGVGPLVTDSSGVLTAITPGASGFVLTSTGASTQPTWQASGSSGAPVAARYWLSSATGSSGLTNAVDLGTQLSSGIVKVGVSGSIATPQTASPGGDYYAPDFPTRLFDSSSTSKTIAIGKNFSSGGLGSLSGSLFIGSNITLGSGSQSSVYLGSDIAATGNVTGDSNAIVGSAAGYAAIIGGNVALFGFSTAAGCNISESVAIGDRCLTGSGTTGSVTNSSVVGPLAGTGIQGNITDTVILGGQAVATTGAAYGLVDCVLLGGSATAAGTVRTITNSICIGKGSQVTSDNSCVVGAPGGNMKVAVNGAVPTHTMHLFNGSTLSAALSIEGSSTAVPAANAGASVFYSNSSGQASIVSSLTNSSGIIPTVNGSLANGDILYGVTASTMRLNKLAIGTTGQGLVVSGGLPSWGAIADGSATYITTTANASIPNAFPLSGMATGLVKVTNITGALTTASAGSDYQAPYAVLTSAGTSGSTAGSLWYGSGTNTIASLAAGTSGYLLSSGGAGAPTWVTPPAALPTVPSGGSQYKLSTWNGSPSWATRSPMIARAPSSNNQSTWPDSADANSYTLKYVTDAPFTPRSLKPTSESLDLAGVEMGIPGFNATVTGQKYFFSLYFISGWNTDTPGSGGIPLYGWMNPTTMASTSLSGANYVTVAGKAGWCYGGFPINSTTLSYRDDAANQNYTWNWGGSMNYNAKIISIGYDTTAATITFWQHDAVTGALLGSASKTPSSSIQSQTNMVPWFAPFVSNAGAVTNASLMQVMSTGYPTISGYTYFYAR